MIRAAALLALAVAMPAAAGEPSLPEAFDDFVLADYGFVGAPDSLVIRDANGAVVWDMDQWSFLAGPAPETVNPSLWRQATLNAKFGLYEVTDGIWQVRGYDLSNLSVIEGDTGYIVVDPLITAEAAEAAMALVYRYLPRKPVVAVLYSHSHADHFGGVKGVVSEEAVADGRVRIVAPQGFMEHAVSENVLAGNAMTRRASYMFGTLLPRGPTGSVGVGLGKSISAGRVTLIEPTDVIAETGEELVLDGVRFVFMNTPHAEAPAEFMFYLPERKAFYAAEEANATLHNLYTLRGAQVRDARLWSEYLDRAIAFIEPDTEVLFGGHHWPRRGHSNIVDYLARQRDAYRYIHDQTLRLANHGYTMLEIAERIELPEALASAWFNRGYYGSVNHNSKAVYQKYLGFFDGNPANLHRLPPAESAPRYVEFMGGAEALLAKARAAYEREEYRWVAEVVNHLVFAQPDNVAARELQAAALEQLGFAAESGPWRNFYLTGARELQNGVMRAMTPRTASADMLKALSVGQLFDYMAVRLDGPRAADTDLRFDVALTDSGERYGVEISNGVLHHAPGTRGPAGTTLRLGRDALLALAVGAAGLDQLEAGGRVSIDGERDTVASFFALLDTFDFWFDIVTP